jgi:hypothetical protein
MMSMLIHQSGTLSMASGKNIGVWLLFVLGVCSGFKAVAASGSAADPARNHWAFHPVHSPPIPSVKNSLWARNPVDRFVLADLEAVGVQPGAAADKATLLRRVSLDLTGLPPTPDELNGFLADTSPDAFEKVVNRLLASPQYGERWARHWLDLARYAESEGFKADETRPYVWRYRDYVIQSFNADKPYDRFIQEQLAADELWPAERELQVATAFNRHYPDESNARNIMQRRQEILNDITDTVGSVFLGLSYGCARCHDHKYDPILQTDYYRLQAFFANTAANDGQVLASPESARDYQVRMALWEERTREIRDELEKVAAPHRRAIEKDYLEKYPAEIQAILEKPESDRNPFERQMAWKTRQYLDPASHEYIGDDDAVAGRLKGESKKRWDELQKQLKEFASLHPGELPRGSTMRDLGPEAPKTFLLSRGLYDKPGQEVEPGLLQILYPQPPRISASPGDSSTHRRSTLARLLTDPANPLTARVMVNRVWQYHFGRGIVGTSSDFGLKGDKPTHPALLDWLTAEFTSSGWSLKKLHRLIVLSSTYQQSSAHRDFAARVDPANKLFWKYPRHRLEGEVIRDAALSAAGLLNLKMGGPSIFPDLPTGMPAPRGGWKVTAEENERNRRSIYVFVRRNTRYPMFDSFDMPDPHESCARRNVTTSPIQALTLLNSHLALQWAQSFAGRVLSVAGANQAQQVETAFRIAYGRSPDRAEERIVRDFLKTQRELIAGRMLAGSTVSVPGNLPTAMEPADAAALVDLCHMLINANEFVYMN